MPVSSLSPSSTTTNDKVQKSQSSPAVASIRSCITCKRRKVKCDKKAPCSTCVKARAECIFPSAERARRRPKRLNDTDLLARLKRVESVVNGLGGALDEEEDEGEEEYPLDRPTLQFQGRNSHSHTKSLRGQNTDVAEDFGKLIVKDGRSQYVSNQLWAGLSDEVQDLKGMLRGSSHDEEDDDPATLEFASPWSSANPHGFIFGFCSIGLSLRSLHPSPGHVIKLWQAFLENINPLTKLIHAPTTQKALFAAIENLDNVSKGMEALMFSIYYSAVISLSPDSCETMLGEKKEVLLGKYKFAVEQSLSRAGFVNSTDCLVLQSLVLFLLTAHRHDNARSIWTLTGLAVRIGQSIGLHHDGARFSLTPFEVEMRRRLWWQIAMLDSRSSEINGSENNILAHSFDTKIPSNVNDSDLHPDMGEPPTEHEGTTEMTFCIMRCDIASSLRRLTSTTSVHGTWHSLGTAALSLREKDKFIDETQCFLEKKYARYYDSTIPLYYVAAVVCKLVICKMRLMAHHPRQYSDGGAHLPQEKKNLLFIRSLEVIEYSNLFESTEGTQKWAWHFQTYFQWHAFTYLLGELCIRKSGHQVERAWRAVGVVLERYRMIMEEKNKELLWKMMESLINKAWAVREQELLRQRQGIMNIDGDNHTSIRSSKSLADNAPPSRSLPREEFSPIPPFTFAHTQSALNASGLTTQNEQSALLQCSVSQPNDFPTLSGDEFLDPLTMPDPLSTGQGPLNWTDWENLVRDFQMR